MDRLLHIDEVATQLGICPRHVHRLVSAGQLPRPVKIGKAARFPASDIEEYMERLKAARGTSQ